MTTQTLISVLVPLAGLIFTAIALVFNGMQVRRAAQALLLNEQVTRGNAVMHFTDRFFDLTKDGEPTRRFNDSNWTYEFWSLHATEFYFFHHGILPVFMYSLWMIELAKMYCGPDGTQVRESHKRYLNIYSSNYLEMIEFYNHIYQIADKCGDDNLRNREVATFITEWIRSHRAALRA